MYEALSDYDIIYRIMALKDETKPEKKLWCYSLEGFNSFMRDTLKLRREGDEGLIDRMNVAVISICTTECVEEHYFKKSGSHVLNINFDDIDPDSWFFGNFDPDEASPRDYVYKYPDSDKKLYALNSIQARAIVDFIDANLGCDFYIHCSAGVSRSQGVVRYILDTYDEYIWQIRRDNPPFAPNCHVVRMLKRAKREKDNK